MKQEVTGDCASRTAATREPSREGRLGASPECRTIAGVMPLARQLGDKLDLDPIPPLEPIDGHVFRCNRKSFWGPEAWDEMQRIWNGEQE